MHGFTTEGLLIFPKYETWDTRGWQYQNYLRRTVEAVIKYFRHYGVTFKCMTTDDVAISERPEGVKWVDVIPPEDKFFIKRNCEGMDIIPEDTEKLEAIYELSREKYPLERGLSVEERFDGVVVKREKFIYKEFVKNMKLVVSFEHTNNKRFRVPSQEGDGRIILEAGNTNFIVKATFSGQPVDPVFLLQDPGAARAMYYWEVNND